MLITTLCTETSFLCPRRASLTKKKREKSGSLVCVKKQTIMFHCPKLRVYVCVHV